MSSDQDRRQKIKAAVSGSSLVLAFAAASYWLVVGGSDFTTIVRLNYLFASLFIGISTGHYFGKSIVSGGDVAEYIYLGVAVTTAFLFTGYTIFTTFGISIAAILICSSLSIILAHDVDYFEKADELDQLVEQLASRVSPLAVTIIMGIKIISSFAVNNSGTTGVSVSEITTPIYALLQLGIVMYALYIGFKHREKIAEYIDNIFGKEERNGDVEIDSPDGEVEESGEDE